MPQSNKWTAGLPSPHTVGLQSCCSAPLGSLPHGLRQATALHQIHTPPPPGSLPLRPCQTLAPHWIHAPPRPLPLGWAKLDPCPTGTPTYWALPDPHLTRTPTTQACSPSGSAGPQLHMGWPEPCPTRIPTPQGWAPAWCETATSPSMLGFLPLRQSQASALQAFQITTPPGSHLGCH
jgi:hypothetical protein